METERIALSQEERDRLHLLRELERGELRQVAAAQRMKLTDRQVRRLLQRWREQGDRAVIHRLRGRPSNRKFAVSFQRKVLAACGSALCRLRTHAGRRALGPGRVSAEPRDLAELDDPSGLLASAPPAREKDPRLAGAQGQLRGVGDAG